MLEAPYKQQKVNIWSAAITLSIVATLTRVTAFATQIVIAHYFGSSIYTDAYFVVENILLTIGDFIVIGFTVAFIPIWMEYRVRYSEQTTQAFASSIFWVVTAIALIIALILMLTAPILVKLVVPGFSDQAKKITIHLLVLMAPAVAFLGLTAGCTGILEAHRRFIIPEFSRMIYNLAIFCAAVTLSGTSGVNGLAWGTIAGSFLRLIVQLPSTLRFNIIHFSQRINREGVQRVAKLLVPIFIAYSGMRINLLLGSMVASGLSEGAVSALAYSSRVMLLPVGLLALPLGTTIFPTLSQEAAQYQIRTLGEVAIRGLSLLSFVMIPVSTVFILFRIPIIQLLFERGAFGRVETSATATLLGLLAIGLPAVGGMWIMNSIYFSLAEPTSLVRFNVILWVMSLGFSLVLVRQLGPNGIAMSISVSITVIYIVAILSLKHKLPDLAIRSLGISSLKSIIAAGIMAIVILGFNVLFSFIASPISSASGFNLFTFLLIKTVLGCTVYGIAAWTLRIEDAQIVIQSLSQWTNRFLSL